MSDLINRQALCDDLREYKVYPVPGSSDESEVKGYNDGIDLAISVIAEFPSAEPERKKGKWIEIYGYATPGGDPVWKCSECGKGIHVYGIEAPSYNRDYTDGHQWVACPNCGAEMTR